MLLFAANVQEPVLIKIVTVFEECANNICTILYIRKIPMHNILSKYDL